MLFHTLAFQVDAFLYIHDGDGVDDGDDMMTLSNYYHTAEEIIMTTFNIVLEFQNAAFQKSESTSIIRCK